jgi:hypothetical protein
MGFLRKAAAAFGHIDKDLIERGILARGRIVECKRTGMSTGVQIQMIVCNLTIEVELEGQPPYIATCKHPIPIPYLAQAESGQGYVAVRVDPDDPQNIAVDPTADVPGGNATVRTIDASQGIPADIAQQLASAGITLDDSPAPPVDLSQPLPNRESEVSAQQILESGTPCRAIVQSAQPLGFQKDGLDVWGIVLNAIDHKGATAQARIGIGVPAEAVALLFPGATLPAKKRADIQDGVAIDWAAALVDRP